MSGWNLIHAISSRFVEFVQDRVVLFFEVPEEKSVQGYLIQRRACFEKYSSSGTMHVCEKHLGFWSYITLQKRLYRNEDLPPYIAVILNLLRLLRSIINGDLRDTMIIPSLVKKMLSMRSPSTFQDYVLFGMLQFTVIFITGDYVSNYSCNYFSIYIFYVHIQKDVTFLSEHNYFLKAF